MNWHALHTVVWDLKRHAPFVTCGGNSRNSACPFKRRKGRVRKEWNPKK